MEAAPGRHLVEVRAERHTGQQRTIDLAPGARETLRIALAPIVDEEPGVLSRWWFWTGVGVLVAGLVTGIYLAENPIEGDPVEGSLGVVVPALEAP
jgi:hypothetical protein